MVSDIFYTLEYLGMENSTTAKEFDKTNDLRYSHHSFGQIVGEVLMPLDNEHCTNTSFLPSFF